MIEIIPAIDLIDGKCVRLSQGDFERKKVYADNPFEVAKSFEEAGVKRLHIVDLDGAKNGHITNQKVLESIAQNTSLIIDMGGGVRTEQDVQLLLDSGATYVSVGSIAYKDPELFAKWVETFGANRFLLGADVKSEKIAVHGWTDTTELSVFDFIKSNQKLGIRQVFCTDIATDGMLTGPAIELYQSILQQFSNLQLIASGGVASMNDIHALDKIGCNGVIVGKAIYEERITLQEISKFISNS